VAGGDHEHAITEATTRFASGVEAWCATASIADRDERRAAMRDAAKAMDSAGRECTALGANPLIG
jgi:hypothetical protein